MERHETLEIAKRLERYWNSRCENRGQINQIIDPATDEEVAELCQLNESDLNLRIDRLRIGKTFDQAVKEKLIQLRRKVVEDRGFIAGIITLEAGKVLKESFQEVDLSLRYFDSYLGAYDAHNPITLAEGDSTCRILLEPVGKTALITPWNFPWLMLARKVIPALIAGAPVILKPAPETCLTAIYFWSLASEAGFDDSNFTLAICNEQTFGRLICDRFDIRKISFTGSTEVGRWLYEKSSKTLKRLTLELGGNAPLIITESAVEEKFLRWLQYSKFRNCGQACTAVNRVLTHSKHFSTVLNYYRKIADDLTVGNGFDETSCIGPVISYALVKKIKSLIEDALKNGATIYPETINFESKFIPPIVLFNVSTNSRLFQEEIFGPVVPIYEAESDDQLLALANQTEYGLSCYLFCEDESKIEHFCENLDFEMIGINRGFVSLPEFPFGGRKASGFGKEGSGMFGIKEFLNFKNLVS